MTDTATFTHQPTETKSVMGGVQHLFKFDNQRGASVICHRGSYGGDAGLYELAVLDACDNLDYSTPVTDDVLGWLTPELVNEALDAIAALPGAEAVAP